MSDDSKIEWTDATWPITVGCTRVSAGCGDGTGGGCYAEQSVARVNRCQVGAGRPAPYEKLVKLVKRDGRTVARWTNVVQFFPERLAMPLRWKRPRRIFVSSQSDLLHDDVTNEQIAAVFGVMAAAPQHTFQVLTKRAKRMREWFEWVTDAGEHRAIRRIGDAAEAAGAPVYVKRKKDGRSPWNEARCSWPLPNVWIGVSVENQAAADDRIPELLATPAAVRWISAEPLLGPVVLQQDPTAPLTVESDGKWHSRSYLRGVAGDVRLNWIVAGCESGPGSRPCDVEWLRSLRDQCAAAGVAYFAKQATAWDEGRTAIVAMGIGFGPGSHRKAGGVIGLPYLDGRQHTDLPEVRRG